MKLFRSRPVFWAVVLSLGAVGGALRLGTFGPAMDEKGLILYTHPLVLGLLICTLIALALSLILAGKSGGSNQFQDNFQPSRLAAVGHYILAVGIFSTALLEQAKVGGWLGMVWQVLGLAAPIYLGLAGYARYLGRPACLFTHMTLCLYFVFHVVNQYRTWSADPQLTDYLFALMASISLILFSYYQTAFDVDAGKRKPMLFWGLMGIYLCLSNLTHTEEPLVYLTGAIWMATNLCALEPVPQPESQQMQTPAPEDASHVSA